MKEPRRTSLSVIAGFFVSHPARSEKQEMASPIFDTPKSHRRDFRKWVKGWVERQIGCRAPRAVRVRGPKTETPWVHWLLFSYLMKGYDQSALVQSARNSPDGQSVFLGDLIPWPWVDPGPVALKQRVGWSRSLGPDRRALGAPGGMDYLLKKTHIVADGVAGFKAVHQPSPGQAFRSKFDDGIRDARLLYPESFYTKITGQEPWPAFPREHDDEWLEEFIETLNV